METKKFWLSKTFWFNFLSGALALIAIINTDFLAGLGVAPEKQTMVLTITAAIVAVVNIALRFITTAPVSIK